MDIFNILEEINISCIDDGSKIVDRRKIDQIVGLLRQTCFNTIYQGKLCIIFSNKSLEQLKLASSILVSSHVDTAYHSFFEKETATEIIGTLDNSITNAILIEQAYKLESIGNFIFTFTGNEEKDSKGVDETISFLLNQKIHPEFVISLDTVPSRNKFLNSGKFSRY